jgi:hypothetical protein
LKLLLVAYAQAFPNFVVLPFITPSPTRTTSKSRFGTINIRGVEEGTRTIMEANSIVVEMAIESTYVAPNTTEATTKTMHPSTLSTIIEIERGIENPQMRDGIRVTLMFEQIVFWKK